ncbi:MAG: TolC family protein [Armatimonadetes bacterium]|nr:TolC family protein [Armatimonadota bacterium]
MISLPSGERLARLFSLALLAAVPVTGIAAEGPSAPPETPAAAPSAPAPADSPTAAPTPPDGPASSDNPDAPTPSERPDPPVSPEKPNPTPPVVAAEAITPPVPDPTLPTPPVTVSPDRPLTLAEAVRIAQQNHANMTVAEESVEAAQARVTQAQSANRPIVFGSVDYSLRGVTGQGTGLSRTTSSAGIQPRATLSYNIFDGGLTRAGVRQAREGVENSLANVVATRNNLGLTVAVNYIAQLRAAQLLELRRNQEELALAQLKRVEARVEVGAAALLESALPLSEYQNRQVERIAVQNDVRVAANALRNAMGLTVGPPLTLTEPTELPEGLLPVDALRELALRERPEIAQAESQREIAEASVAIARIQRRPRLDTQVSAIATPFDNTRAIWDAGASVSMPLWDAGRSRAQQEEAEAAVRSAEARFEQVKKDVTAEVEEAYLNLANARERVPASRQAVEAARLNLEAATERYALEIRGISVVDLISAQVQYDTANTNYIQATYDVHLAQAQLQRALGRTPTGETPAP